MCRIIDSKYDMQTNANRHSLNILIQTIADKKISHELSKKLNQENRTHTITRPTSLENYLDLLSQQDLVISNRMHALILSLVINRKVFGFYHNNHGTKLLGTSNYLGPEILPIFKIDDNEIFRENLFEIIDSATMEKKNRERASKAILKPIIDRAKNELLEDLGSTSNEPLNVSASRACFIEFRKIARD